MLRFLFIVPLLFFQACNSQAQLDQSYWYSGKAEVASYELQQVRYGQVHDGQAVLIFVTEDFSKSKQVKSNSIPAGDSDLAKVLKLNAMREFTTGIYPYNIMQSIFTPVEEKEDYSFKVSTSIQDWCGHTYQQINLREYKYGYTRHSYFENEADAFFELEQSLLEDELFNLIRINPKELPVGEIELIPGTIFVGLMHQSPSPRTAKASLKKHASNPDWETYTVAYQSLSRSLKIHFETQAPYRIMGWEESYESQGKELRTVASYKTHLHIDYWNHNSIQDEVLRAKLQLKD